VRRVDWNRLLAGAVMKNIAVILTVVMLSASAQLCMRKRMLQIGEISFSPAFVKHFPAMLANRFLWIAIFCYAASLILWLIVLSSVPVSFAYMFMSLSYVLVAVMGRLFFNEHISYMRVAGLIVICTGVFIVSKT
jgi:multidrug transporter EmrE-like cation transporter